MIAPNSAAVAAAAVRLGDDGGGGGGGGSSGGDALTQSYGSDVVGSFLEVAMLGWGGGGGGGGRVFASERCCCRRSYQEHLTLWLQPEAEGRRRRARLSTESRAEGQIRSENPRQLNNADDGATTTAATARRRARPAGLCAGRDLVYGKSEACMQSQLCRESISWRGVPGFGLQTECSPRERCSSPRRCFSNGVLPREGVLPASERYRCSAGN